MRYLALLRAINLGSTNKIAMPDLRKLFVELGHGDAQTHLQTGNVVFTADRVEPSDLEKRIAADLGVTTTVLLRTAAEMAEVISANPFADSADPAKLHVTFLAEPPHRDAVAGVDSLVGESEEYAVVGREVFLHCPNGYGRTKLSNANLEKRLKVTATTRNWKVVNALHEMLAA